MTELEAQVRATIRDVPDFPKPGILFKDITPVLANPALFDAVTRWMADPWRGERIDRIVGMESRGFLFGAPLVRELSAGFAPARKSGKLPHATISTSYGLEYGSATLELHADAVAPGMRCLVVDDLLATGGTAAATIDLVRRLGGVVVGCTFLVELAFLEGRRRLEVPVRSLVTY